MNAGTVSPDPGEHQTVNTDRDVKDVNSSSRILRGESLARMSSRALLCKDGI